MGEFELEEEKRIHLCKIHDIWLLMEGRCSRTIGMSRERLYGCLCRELVSARGRGIETIVVSSQ